jgi:hypothetical protein
LTRRRWAVDGVRAVVLLLLALPAACTGSDAQPGAVGFEQAPGFVSETPVLSIGVPEGDPLQAFYQVRTPFLLSEGRVAVPLEGEKVIRVFGSDASFIGSFGREGEGPGEFATVSSAWSRGDTIEVADAALRRLTRFFPDGSVEVIPFRGEAPTQAVPHGVLSDGWVTGAVTGVRMNARDEVALHGFSRSGDPLGELARIEGIERISVPGGSGVHPLTPRSVVRIGADRIYVGETRSPRIRVLDLHGNQEREITWEATDTLAPDDALRALRESPDRLPSAEHLLEGAPVPDALSVFWDFLVDGLGFIWVRPYDPMKHAAALGGLGGGSYLTSPGGGGGRWLVLSPTGEVAGHVDVPDALRPTQVTTDRLIGIHVDALGFESVRVHAVSRDGSEPENEARER